MYHKKVSFPMKISDRAWWLEVQVLKRQGKSSCNRKVDHVGMVRSNLSSKACQPKDVSTKVDLPVASGTSVQTSTPTKVVSCIPHVSAGSDVRHFKNMRRECQIKSFDGLGPFSHVSRMIRFSEPNTGEVEPLEDDLQAESRGFSSEADFKPVFEELCVENNHQYVFGLVEPEHVFGFPLDIDLEQEGENDVAGENENVFDEGGKVGDGL